MNVQHPILGTCTTIPYDRNRKFLGVLLCAAIVAAGIITVPVGVPLVVGIVLVAAGAILGIGAIRRLRMQMSILLGDKGFESFPGVGPVFWRDVALIGVGQMRWSPFMRAHVVLVQLAHPDDFAANQKVNVLRKLALRLNLRLQHGALGLDMSQTGSSAGKAAGLMQARLWAYRQSLPASATPAVSTPA